MATRTTTAPTPSQPGTTVTDRITVTPNPAPAGSEITICYDFDGATSPVTLSLDWDPDQQPDSITLSKADSCKKVTAARDAQGLLISDDSGQSSDEGVTFT